MKTLIALFLVFINTIALSQEYNLDVGSRTGCTGRGICTISIPPDGEKSIEANTSLVQNKKGAIIIRIYRDKLSQDEHDRILGEPINSKNKEQLQFVMDEALPLPEEIIAITSVTKSKQLAVLEAKSYPTNVTDQYIESTIINPD